jgi:hypothetical protein
MGSNLSVRVQHTIMGCMVLTSISRPDKLEHVDTVLYEIDMLRFARSKISESYDPESWSKLECFLLHFRNLIEFFGKPLARGDDLSIQRPENIWDPADRPKPDVLQKLIREDLWEKYEVRDPKDTSKPNDKISRYLQHCTRERVAPKTWDVRQMCDELFPTLDEFEKHLTRKSRPWQEVLPSQMSILSLVSASTASTAFPQIQVTKVSTKKILPNE